MPDAIRKSHFDAVVLGFSQITETNGFNTNIGENLTTWNPSPITERELEGIDLRDFEETSAEETNRAQYHELKIECQVHCQRALLTADWLRLAIADIKKCIGTNRTWGIANTTTLGATTNKIDIIKAGKTVGAAQFIFTIRYRTLTFDPYNR